MAMAQFKNYKEWYDWYIQNDKEDIETMGEIACKSLYKKLSIKIKDYRIPIAIYAVVLDTMMDVLIDREEKYPVYLINVANMFEIGYTNSYSDDAEKVGNFLICMYHIDNWKSNYTDDDMDESSLSICTQWNADNITEDTDDIKEIASRALARVKKELDIPMESVEMIMPIFCYVHESIISYIKIKRTEAEKEEMTINIAALVEIKCFEDAEGEHICFQPTPSSKLTLKDDLKAQKVLNVETSEA